jgi:hypothetical protein
MIDAEGRRLCDKEIWSRANNMWCGCRLPASVTAPSKYICAGLDFCKRHAGRTIMTKALFDDGSGSTMYWRHDDGFIDSDGGEYTELPDHYSLWTELPEGITFWCEDRSEDPMTLRQSPQGSETERQNG